MEEVKKFLEDKNLIWENKDKRSLRAMCLSYAKDLVVNGRLDKGELLTDAQKMFEWVWGN